MSYRIEVVLESGYELVAAGVKYRDDAEELAAYYKENSKHDKGFICVRIVDTTPKKDEI